MRNDYITRLVQICLDIANIADERGEADEPYFKELGLGYRALSGILRRGCKDIIDLQNNYHGAIEAKNLAKIGEQEAHDILKEMFGDREVYTINDKDKERIKAFVRSIQDEWERRTDDLISRQQAIDALAEDMPQTYTPDGSHPADEGIFMAQEIYADCIQTLKELPSAQPEIIRCRECKFASGDSRICMKFGHSPIGELDFCAWAERRTDE